MTKVIIVFDDNGDDDDGGDDDNGGDDDGDDDGGGCVDKTYKVSWRLAAEMRRADKTQAAASSLSYLNTFTL